MRYLILITAFFVCLFTAESIEVVENITGEKSSYILDVKTEGNEIYILSTPQSFSYKNGDIYKFQNGNFSKLKITDANGEPVNVPNSGKFEITDNNEFIVLGRDGIFKSENNNWSKLDIDLFNETTANYYSLALDNDNSLWVLFEEEKSYYLKSGILNKNDKSEKIIDESVESSPKFTGGLDLRFSLPVTSENEIVTYVLPIGDDTLNSKDDIVFYNNEGISKSYKLPSLNGKHEYKVMNQIYEDSQENLWFAFGGRLYNHPEGGQTKTLSGLSVKLNTGEWIHFDSERNYPEDEDGMPMEAKGIIETKEGEEWFVIMEKEIIKIDDEFDVSSIDWNDFLNKSIFYSSVNSDKQKLLSYFSNLDESPVSFAKINRTDDGRIWVNSNVGILMHDADLVSVETKQESGINIYPNPIQVNNQNLIVSGLNESKIKEVRILNLTGQVITDFKWDYIDNKLKLKFLNKLSSGVYFIEILGKKSSKHKLKFSVVN